MASEAMRMRCVAAPYPLRTGCPAETLGPWVPGAGSLPDLQDTKKVCSEAVRVRSTPGWGEGVRVTAGWGEEDLRQKWDQQDQLLLLSPREIPEQFLPCPFSPSPRNVFFGYVKCQVNCNYTCQEVATQVQLCNSAVRKHIIKQAEMNFALYFIWL